MTIIKMEINQSYSIVEHKFDSIYQLFRKLIRYAHQVTISNYNRLSSYGFNSQSKERKFINQYSTKKEILYENYYCQWQIAILICVEV